MTLAYATGSAPQLRGVGKGHNLANTLSLKALCPLSWYGSADRISRPQTGERRGTPWR